MSAATEADTMAIKLSPEFIEKLFTLRDAVMAAGHGERRAMVDKFAAEHGKSAHSIYAYLKAYAGFDSGRKKRSDAGKTALPLETLEFIGAAKREAVRGNGKQTMPTAVAMDIAAQNGLDVTVSEGRISKLLRQHRMDTKSVSRARTTGELRSEHPNHVHQIDPSLCVLYYMGGRQKIMRDEEFNKNKLGNYAKVKLKVWRYVRYDHASGSIDVRYFESAGENQQTTFEFLLWTWGKQESRLSYGVPKMLLWDKGSANIAHGIQKMLDALGVHHETHATGHSWAKGGAEVSNNIVETQFETRLRFEPVETIEQLNAAAQLWARDYNANAIPHVDSRIVRKSGVPMVRDELWQKIIKHPGALIEMPERSVCQWFMSAKDVSRQVRNLKISFAHPELEGSATYCLREWSEFVANGENVTVTPLLGRGGAVRISIERLGKEPLLIETAPNTDFDEYGRSMGAQLLGEGYSRAPDSAGEIAAKRLIAAAYEGAKTLDEADALRSKQAKPFAHLNEGKGVVAHSHLGQNELPTRILPKAQELDTSELQFVKSAQASVQTVPLSIAEACAYIKALVGAQYDKSLYAQLSQDYKDGVPQAVADDIVRSILHPSDAQRATGTHNARPVLSIVKGGTQ